MNAVISNNGQRVLLDSNLDIENETAEFIVSVAPAGKKRTKFVFHDFTKAARVYKDIGGIIEAGADVSEVVDELKEALVGCAVKEVA